MPDGRKLWRFKYVRHSGSESRLGFGVYPGVTLAQARSQRETARAIVGRSWGREAGRTPRRAHCRGELVRGRGARLARHSEE
ncbi:hypothetical protein CBM2587_A170056 [Cupriavidus taiwanensis]|uniref:Integrase DNA-binding domain-containing protein n=1 Tax=Cupriavidus taiwanensis TaxID=164546 RepID=A0A975WY23_9BURK|nr:hypothetical protein CBM2587_A170056 [Cupriavidus taiwanensis]